MKARIKPQGGGLSKESGNTSLKTGSHKQKTGKQLLRFVPPLVYAVVFALWIILAPSLATAVQEGGARVAAGVAMGSYLALFLVFFILFMILKSLRLNLFFALACLAMFMQTGLANARYMPYAFQPVLTWLAGNRIDFVMIPAIGILAVCVFHQMFPGLCQKWFLNAFYILTAVFSVALLFAGRIEFEMAGWGCVGLFLAALLYSLIRLISKQRRFSIEQIVFLIGALFVVYSATGDILRLFNVGNRFVLFFFPFISVGNMADNAIFIYSLILAGAFLQTTASGIRKSGGEKYRLAATEMLTQSQLEFQREQFGQIKESVESVRFMRHDMKHHFAVLGEYAQAGNISGIRGYMEGLDYGLIASRGKIHCENNAVNAILTHYLSQAENDGAELKVKLTVPAETGQVRDSDLCVIIGNLLDNAVAACRDVPPGDRFIRLFSYVDGNTLTFTMENSFDGKAGEEDGVFYSRKRGGEGFGLSSVKAVAARYGGAARFEAKNAVFLSSVYVVL